MRHSFIQTQYPGQARAFMFAAWIMAALAFFPAAQVAPGGNLDSPAPPASAGSALYTLSDIYDALSNFSTTNKRAGAFTEPVGGPTNGAWTGVTLDQVYQAALSNATCSIVPKTGITVSYRAGDDGALHKGWPWPTPRFTVQANTNCVLDNLTGLMWTRNANLAGTMTWTNAILYCSNMNAGAGTYGYKDWRLPNVLELLSLVDYSRSGPALCSTDGTGQWTPGDPFNNVVSAAYWTSDPFMPTTTMAKYVSLASGMADDGYKTTLCNFWPVRGGAGW